MKVVILAGGLGTRLSEETVIKPKPMVEIGDRPILWHIMKIYSHYGFDDFIILLGHKGSIIKDYFLNLENYSNDIHLDLESGDTTLLTSNREKWKVSLVETGESSMTGSRVAQALRYTNNESFLLTYGDGLSDVDINKLIEFHKNHGKLATMTSVVPDQKFGVFEKDDSMQVTSFSEKPQNAGQEINGGFFVFEPEIKEYLNEDKDCVLEEEPLKNLASDSNLYAYPHKGYWRCMDTLKDKNDLNKEWLAGSARWKVW